MISSAEKTAIAKTLQAKINMMQGLGKISPNPLNSNLLPFSAAFPNQIFPTGVIHEFISYESADVASTQGFMATLISKFIKDGSLCLWIGNEQKTFPLGLRHFGLEPDRIIFINVPKLKDALWIIEEALRCEAITVVIGEVKELSFTESRRMQLAVEQSNVTGFIHRICPHSENATACTARWNITPLPSVTTNGLPGLGHPNWNVDLSKIKNGTPKSWQVSWSNGRFMSVSDTQIHIPSIYQRNAG